ncbi:MAG: hypothetical protein ABR927_14220 [Bacteroidales bacterium]
MRTILFASIFILSRLISSGQNLKALDDKNGFREAKFGMSASSFKKLEQMKEPPLVGLDPSKNKNVDRTKLYPVKGSYYDKDVDLHIGNFPLDYVVYHFYKDKLVSIGIKVSQGLTNQNGVLEVLETAYGKGVFEKNDDKWHPITYRIWEGEKVKMVYTLGNDLEIVGIMISISSKELENWEKRDIIIEEQKAEQQKRQAIQEAAKKL